MELDFKAGHDTLAGLWVRVISVHYAAIARHWKDDGIDLLGDHGSKLDSSVSADDDRRTEDFRGLYYACSDDVLRTGVFDGLQAVFDSYDLIVSPHARYSSGLPPRTNGNTIGPTEINGDKALILSLAGA